MKRIPKISGIEVRRSPKKGRGVFAVKKFKAGSIIEISPILRLRDGDYLKLAKTVLANYMFEISTCNVDNAAIAFGYASLYNHSSDPNAAYVVNTKTITIIATKNIGIDDEISIDYGWTHEHMLKNKIVEA